MNSRKLKKFLSYYKPYLRLFAADMVCALGAAAISLVYPLIVRYITNDILINYEISEAVGIIAKLALVMVGLALLELFCNYFISYQGHIMGAKMEFDMRNDIFHHFQKLSFSFYDNQKTGQLMSRITNDLFEVTELSHHGPEDIVISIIKFVGAFIILIRINVPLTLLLFLFLPVMFIFAWKMKTRMNTAFKANRQRIADINAQIEDNLSGIRVVKSFANESVEEEKFEGGNLKFLGIKTKVYHIMAGFQASTRLFEGIMYIVVVVVGALFIMKGEDGITVADYMAYLMFVSTLLTSIRRIVEFAEQFQRGMTGIERFCEIMDIEPEIADAKNAEDIGDVKGDIEFSGVSFHYESDTKNVITSLDLSVKAGESIALVGPSGGGKTTLCSLIPRFYELSEGKILIDGKDIREVTLSSLRSAIGVVAQDVYLFSGSIRENIAYGKRDATDEEIRAAARLAGADEFIETLPDGYDTYVGERGVKLSGGQKQRISIARVFLKNPPILILDEATSALDNESERLVQQSLEALAKGRTTFTIAHRLTTVRNADRILVLTEDGIAESGKHEELVAKGGIYSELYRMYSNM